MEVAYHNPLFIPSTGNPKDIFPELRDRAQYVDDHGFKYFLLNDHLWQIGVIGPPEQPFLESYRPWRPRRSAQRRSGATSARRGAATGKRSWAPPTTASS